MLRLVTISLNPGRVRIQRRIFPTLEVFEATGGCTNLDYRQVCIPETYRRLALWGVEEGLDRKTVVMQDDVWMPHGGGLEGYVDSFDTPLLVFGTTEADGVVVPKAFSASPEIWQALTAVWDGETRIGPAWMPLIEQYGTVLNVTRNIG